MRAIPLLRGMEGCVLCDVTNTPLRPHDHHPLYLNQNLSN
jgi:hypothetical protein